jgi:hypothetical protein
VLAKALSKEALEALNNGKGSAIIGGNMKIEVGSEMVVLGMTYVKTLAPDLEKLSGADADEKKAEFYKMSEEERKEYGREIEYWALTTNCGTVSLGSLFGRNRTVDWSGDKVVKVDNFDDYTPYSTPTRNVESFIEIGLKKLLNKTIKCIAQQEYTTSNGQPSTLRLWTVL